MVPGYYNVCFFLASTQPATNQLQRNGYPEGLWMFITTRKRRDSNWIDFPFPYCWRILFGGVCSQILLMVQKSQTTTVWMYKKPCKSWDLNYLSTGARFLPSTAVSTQPKNLHSLDRTSKTHGNIKCLSPENMCEMIPNNVGTVDFHGVKKYHVVF